MATCLPNNDMVCRPEDEQEEIFQAYRLIVVDKDEMRAVAADPNVIAFRGSMKGGLAWFHDFVEGAWYCHQYQTNLGELKDSCPIHGHILDDRWVEKTDEVGLINYHQHPTTAIPMLDPTSTRPTSVYYTGHPHGVNTLKGHYFRLFEDGGIWTPVATYSLYHGSERIGKPHWKCSGYDDKHCPFFEQHMQSLCDLELRFSKTS